MAGRVDSLAFLTCEIWYAMSSSSPGTSTMVTVCPLFTTWVLVASFRSAVLVVTACLTVRAPSLWCPGRVPGQESQFPKESSPVVKDRSGTMGWTRVIPLDWSVLPWSFGSGKSPVFWFLDPTTGEVVALGMSSFVGLSAPCPVAEATFSCALAGDCDGPLRVSRTGPAFGELSDFDFRGPEASYLLGPLVAAAASPTAHPLTLGWMAGGIVSLSVRTSYWFIT